MPEAIFLWEPECTQAKPMTTTFEVSIFMEVSIPYAEYWLHTIQLQPMMLLGFKHGIPYTKFHPCYPLSCWWSLEMSEGRSKTIDDLLNRRALKISTLYKDCIFQCMDEIFCVEFERYPLKFHTKYLTHTFKDISVFETPPGLFSWQQCTLGKILTKQIRFLPFRCVSFQLINFANTILDKFKWVLGYDMCLYYNF